MCKKRRETTFRKLGKKIKINDETMYFGKLYRIVQLLIGIQSENCGRTA